MDNEDEMPQDHEKERLERMESAMRHEGSVSWSMERARAPQVLLQAVPSELIFEDKPKQINYCKMKLRSLE